MPCGSSGTKAVGMGGPRFCGAYGTCDFRDHLKEDEHKITNALDAINAVFGKGTIKFAVQGSGKIKSSSDNQSPHYTTLWSDIPNVTVK